MKGLLSLVARKAWKPELSVDGGEAENRTVDGVTNPATAEQANNNSEEYQLPSYQSPSEKLWKAG